VSAAVAAGQVARLDGVILAGGQDLDATLWGEPRDPRSTWLDADRDRHERAVWEAACARALPVLGICRGLQLVGQALGGRIAGHVDGHDSGAPASAAGHTVAPAAGSALERAVGAGVLRVNSIHHQAIAELPADLVATALAPDGLVEAVESRGERPWFVGVQWHPELMLAERGGQPLFDALVAAVKSARTAT
jgi:putative glutamine amidotransferase